MQDLTDSTVISGFIISAMGSQRKILNKRWDKTIMLAPVLKGQHSAISTH